ncbi:rhodanese-like domain-containing protein [Peribacillus asahii]|uniref:Sulfurtransferase n=1 Tax=Peribacillus asahii TaxID=228899 RepID=A0A3T0KL67_9BACI|nr:rhodanese-like domain-containing protein [Peribacillus asahii]AZV41028.1 sulfurtransferase [Peribacillus asahii]USK85446.1 rhodanese-like domain-containing protein [Peribacillus asahii]
MSWITLLMFVTIAVFALSKVLPVKGVKSITTEDLANDLSLKVKKQYIDVRSEVEYNDRHIPQFGNIPLHLLKQRVNELDKKKPVVIICHSGMRSIGAAKILKKLGFEQIENVSGGINAWRD